MVVKWICGVNGNKGRAEAAPSDRINTDFSSGGFIADVIGGSADGTGLSSLNPVVGSG